MSERSGVEVRLILTLVVIALVAIAGVLVLLPYRLYERDIRRATAEAHRVSSIVQAALVCPLRDGGTAAAELIDRIQGVGDLQVALARVEAGEVQPGAVTGRGSSVLDDTDLRYVSSLVKDEEGRAWVAEMHFDLAPMKRESIRLIIDLVLAVAVGATIFSLVIYLLFRRAFVRPLQELTRCVERMASGETGVAIPRFESREMGELAAAIQRITRS